MSNPILKVFTDLSLDELETVANELEHAEETGTYPENAMIRKIARKLSDINGLDTSSNLLFAQIGVYKEIAKDWKAQRDIMRDHLQDMSIMKRRI